MARITPVGRIRGLDAIRFFAAVWVLCFHQIGPFGNTTDANTYSPEYILSSLYHYVFNGLAAVVAFFIISGFCVHWPAASGQSVNIYRYVIRRYLRVGLPMALLLVIAYFAGDGYPRGERNVFWTLYCEIIYYTLYPIFFYLFGRFGVRPILLASLLISMGIAIFFWDLRYPSLLRFYIRWIEMLPYWIAGCLLAESISRRRFSPLVRGIWWWRAAVVVCAASGTALAEAPAVSVGYMWSLLPFGLLAYHWIKNEIILYSDRKPSTVLEWCGQWSYSIYLVHMPFIDWGRAIFGDTPASWLVQLVSGLIGSYVFYVLVERPSHRLARFVSSLGAPGSRAAGFAASMGMLKLGGRPSD